MQTVTLQTLDTEYAETIRDLGIAAAWRHTHHLIKTLGKNTARHYKYKNSHVDTPNISMGGDEHSLNVHLTITLWATTGVFLKKHHDITITYRVEFWEGSLDGNAYVVAVAANGNAFNELAQYLNELKGEG